MKKIFELGPEQFMSGIASGSQLQDSGLFVRAEGITTVRNPFVESDELGILQASPEPTDLTGSVIEDTCTAWVVDPADPVSGTPVLYVWGLDGQLYSIDLVEDNYPISINDGLPGMGPAANGLFIVNHSTGEKNIYFFRVADIGYYGDLNNFPTFNGAIYSSDIVSTQHHPVHRLFDRCYFGNGRYIGTIEDDGAGALTIVGHALDLEEGFTVTTVSDDGHYLVAGASTNPPVAGGGGGPLPHGTNKIIFWDTNSNSWEREWPVEGKIFAIRRVGTTMRVLTSTGLYAFTIDSPPTLLLPLLNTSDAPTSQFPSHFTADVLGEALVWGNAGGSVSAFGKFTPAMRNAYGKPFSGFGSSVELTMVIASAKTNDLYVGNFSDQLFRVHWGGDGNALTGVSAETIFIDLKRWYQVGRIVVEFESPLESGDALNLWVRQDSAADPYLFGAITYTGNGAAQTVEMFNSIEARKLAIVPAFGGGNVRIRNIQVWGDPIERPVLARLT